MRATSECIVLSLLLVAPLRAQAERITAAEIGATPNLTTLSERIFFAGQPGSEDFGELAQQGVKTVVNLRTAAEMERLDFDERALVEAAGMRYVHVPIAGEEPPEETVAQLMDLLDDEASHPLLLHCASSNRVGYVWSLFRGSRQAAAVETALAEGRSAGMRSPTLEQRARAYLEAAEADLEAAEADLEAVER